MNNLFTRIIMACIYLLIAAPIWSAEPPPQPATRTTAPVNIFNRTIVEFRAPFLGIPTQERAQRTEEVLRRLLAAGGTGTVTSKPNSLGYSVMLDGVLAFVMIAEDADPLKQETLETAAVNAAKALQQVVHETREARNLSVLLQAAGLVLTATLLLLLLIWLLRHARNWLTSKLSTLAHVHSEKLSVGGEAILQRERLFLLVQRAVQLLYWLLLLVLLNEWLGFALERFPYTRPWGEKLNQRLADMALSVGQAVLRTVPNLLIAILIFMFAKFIIDLLKTVFERVEQGKLQLAWLDQDTVLPTRRLVSAFVWLFAFTMAYPYLPGAQTAAFKGVSVLVGLMVSLGASSLVGQAASGLILMYTRTIRAGEYVQIATHEGTVMELGLFTTRIRTGMGEELTLPNSLILSNVSRNFSRTVQGAGYILNATVTIGYDTPWRQVHAMLIEAAQRTDGVLADPVPHVFQTALSDFYPEYRLVCQAVPREPHPRAELMNTLHGNIQDVFNEYGVQIMSPHYRGDPADPKIVPQEQWYPLPAVKPADSKSAKRP